MKSEANSIHNFLKNISLIFDYRKKCSIFASTNSATLPIEQRTRAELLLLYCVAHHARIWNRRFPLKPQLPRKLKGSWIDVSHTEQVKFYAQLCYLAYLQDCIHPDNTFKKELLDLFAAYPNVDTRAMGFPEDWRSEPLWN